MRLNTAGLLLRGNTQQTVSIDLVADTDTRGTGGHGGYVAQLKPRQRTAAIDQFPLTLYNMQRHGRLTVLESCKFLRACNRDGGVSGNNFLGQSTHGLDAQGQGYDIEQQHLIFGPVARQNVGLYRCTNRHDLVGIDVNQRITTEKLTHHGAHYWHPSGSAHHDNFLNVRGLHPCVTQGAAARRQCFFHQRLDQRLHLGARQATLPLRPVFNNQADIGVFACAERLLGGTGLSHQVAHGGVVRIIRDARLLHDPLGHGAVEVITTERTDPAVAARHPDVKFHFPGAADQAPPDRET